MDTHAIDLSPKALPRCFVIDEAHHVVMECSAQPGAPLKPKFVSDAKPRQLPLVLERAVEVLELNCIAEQTTSKTAVLGGFLVRVQLLGGASANHTAVFIDLAKAA
jgi:hypothetical protein